MKRWTCEYPSPVRAISEAPDDARDADRVAEEPITGRPVPRERDADEAVRR